MINYPYPHGIPSIAFSKNLICIYDDRAAFCLVKNIKDVNI